MITGFTPRLYQESIFSTCALHNTLVVLPTGLGKTNIFLMVAAYRLKQHPKSKILFTGPTRPLISQYFEVFKRTLAIPEEKMAMFTGNVAPEKREKLWKEAQIVFSTPQGLENDIISRRIDLADVSLLGIDEAHRAVGDYSYVWVAKEYMKRARFPKIMGLTASPGSDKETIQEVVDNLSIEDIEVRTHDDPDVKPYIQEIKVRYDMIELPAEFLKIKEHLETCLKSKILVLKEMGFAKGQFVSKMELLETQRQLVSEMHKGNRDPTVLKSLSLVAEAMKVSHGQELLESQGLYSLSMYFDKIWTSARTSKVKAVQNLVQDPEFKAAQHLTEVLHQKGVEHPKLGRLEELLRQRYQEVPNSKTIIFTQYRDSASRIKMLLEHVAGIRPEIFVGQQKKGNTGLSQKQQIAMINDFAEGRFNALIMTSVGEEGLDIPSVDQVVFYEPVPSVIRHVQRRGRTGRQDKGEVIVLVAKGTRDEVYRWSAKHKERRMYDSIKDIRKDIKLKTGKSEDKGLTSYLQEQIPELIIKVDHREKASKVLKELLDKEVKLDLQQLQVGDYVLSSRVGVEYKTVQDFVGSIVDGRLLEQIKELKQHYYRPLVIVEGDQDLYSVRNVHPNAIRGMISTIVVSYGIPILYTKTSRETAEMLFTIAKREQEENSKAFNPHGDRKPASLREQQEYIVSSMPDIGPNLSKNLLKKFGSVRRVVEASEKELKSVDKVGTIKAQRLREVLDADYQDNS
ncbi:DEAD/DEAH box helicase [Candidatus Woesearchaeota archaeon]|nr:DEAD/DEAH box helicase [Candidatus Woesearchaeota archaeon]